MVDAAGAVTLIYRSFLLGYLECKSIGCRCLPQQRFVRGPSAFLRSYMEPMVITADVKQIIGNITGISPDSMSDSASFVDDLGLDSLAILEIAVDVEKTFKIGATEEELQSIRSIQDTVNLIVQRTFVQVS
jgi:acyl carrier protein